ncbi:energy transducer TonB [Ferruginibacter sp. SUN106]|uniref:energy transducer TonB family protein n=1 Tax=Ferruginibacter sp. SUN106 TaxID=2978348 RepID=UPI003D36A083
MKKTVLFFAGIFIGMISFSQQILKQVLIGENGVTENRAAAHSFIAIKKYPGYLQQLHYKIAGPLQKVETFSDSTFTVLQGSYYEYDVNGRITISGYYQNNVKEKEWYYFDDTAKVIKEEKYKAGVLIKTINPDTVKEEKLKGKISTRGEREATFKRGNRDWIKYLSENINPDAGSESAKGGEVRVGFTVNTLGKCVEVYMRKSVELVLDEEAIRVIESSPVWIPALKNGKKINAYRVQPLVFDVREN